MSDRSRYKPDVDDSTIDKFDNWQFDSSHRSILPENSRSYIILLINIEKYLHTSFIQLSDLSNIIQYKADRTVNVH